jgi:hypothetical protein
MLGPALRDKHANRGTVIPVPWTSSPSLAEGIDGLEVLRSLSLFEKSFADRPRHACPAKPGQAWHITITRRSLRPPDPTVDVYIPVERIDDRVDQMRHAVGPRLSDSSEG